MRSKDCRHYSRRELIEIIYELERREERLERKLEKTRAKLKERTERITGTPRPIVRGDRVVAEVISREGQLLDRIYQV